mgnify:CR=1 FL=1
MARIELTTEQLQVLREVVDLHLAENLRGAAGIVLTVGQISGTQPQRRRL